MIQTRRKEKRFFLKVSIDQETALRKDGEV
jgi:hypothetical protein